MSNSGTCLADKIKEKLDLLGDTNTVHEQFFVFFYEVTCFVLYDFIVKLGLSLLNLELSGPKSSFLGRRQVLTFSKLAALTFRPWFVI